MVEGRVGGSNGGKESEGGGVGWKGEMNRQKQTMSNYISILLGKDKLTYTSKLLHTLNYGLHE